MNRDHGSTPSIAEIAALTARLRDLTSAGASADPAARAAFLADKDALIARIDAALAPLIYRPREQGAVIPDVDDARATDPGNYWSDHVRRDR